MEAICASAESPYQLIAREDLIEVMVGETFSLRDLSVIAVDSVGEPLKPIPITIDTDAETNVIINLDEYIRTGDGILALRPGTFRLWIHPFCSGPSPGPNPHKGTFIKYTIKAKW